MPHDRVLLAFSRIHHVVEAETRRSAVEMKRYSQESQVSDLGAQHIRGLVAEDSAGDGDHGGMFMLPGEAEAEVRTEGQGAGAVNDDVVVGTGEPSPGSGGARGE